MSIETDPIFTGWIEIKWDKALKVKSFFKIVEREYWIVNTE